MEDSEIKELQDLHRELAQYLVDQNETILNLRKTIGTLQATLEGDSAPQGGRSALADRYKAYLAAQETTGKLRPNLTEDLARAVVNSLAEKLNQR